MFNWKQFLCLAFIDYSYKLIYYITDHVEINLTYSLIAWICLMLGSALYSKFEDQ